MTIIWIIIFIVSLIALVKGADYFMGSAESIGLSIGLSPFIIGATVIAVGTSLPELVSGLMAAFKGATEIITADVVGSNIANILLGIGIAGVAVRQLKVTKNLIDLDIPLLFASTALFFATAIDGIITTGESVLLLIACIVYILYSVKHKDEDEVLEEIKEAKHKVTSKDYLLLVAGGIGLVCGAKFAIDAILVLSESLNIDTETISLIALALGTSLPEIMVSVRAAMQKKPEIALGNIFGSNTFNLLAVISIPGLFKTLVLDEKTLFIGLPFLAVATFAFIISGISKKIHIWEALMYLIFYALFIGKLFGLV